MLTPLLGAVAFHGMFRVAHILAGIDAIINNLKRATSFIGTVRQVVEKLRWASNDLLRGSARELRRFPGLLLQRDVAAHAAGEQGIVAGLDLALRLDRCRG